MNPLQEWTTASLTLMVLLCLIGADWLNRISRQEAAPDRWRSMALLSAICCSAALSLALALNYPLLLRASGFGLIGALIGALVIALDQPGARASAQPTFTPPAAPAAPGEQP